VVLRLWGRYTYIRSRHVLARDKPLRVVNVGPKRELSASFFRNCNRIAGEHLHAHSEIASLGDRLGRVRTRRIEPVSLLAMRGSGAQRGRSHWEKAETFPVTIILLASYAWWAVKRHFRWTRQERLTERTETASGIFLYCVLVQFLDFYRWVCQAKNPEGIV
jgi:hypothetical protein